MSDFIQWLGSRLKKDDSKVGAEETFEAGRKLGKKEGMERIAELENALQNIASGDTPWLDGYSETPGECYQKYAASVLGKEIDNE